MRVAFSSDGCNSDATLMQPYKIVSLLSTVAKRKSHPAGWEFFNCIEESNPSKRTFPADCSCHRCKHWWLPLFSFPTGNENATRIPHPLPEKNGNRDTITVLFCYIRLRRIILLRSYICLTPSYIALRAVLGANIISLPQSGNIAFA